MPAIVSRIPGLVLAWTFIHSCFAASFGTVVPIHGVVSDIALDERRGVLYAANLSGYRVEVLNTTSKTLQAPIPVALPPSGVALSPNGRFLIVGEYQQPDPAELSACPFVIGAGGIDIFDLDAQTGPIHLSMDTPVLAVAFGADGRALVVMRSATTAPGTCEPLEGGPAPVLSYVLDPASASLQPIALIPTGSMNLPVQINTFPGQIIQAAPGVSGDKSKIYVLTGTLEDPTPASPRSLLIRYDVLSATATVEGFVSQPPLGPRSVSVDLDGTNVMDSWMLLRYLNNALFCDSHPLPCPELWAQLPGASAFNLGSHAWDVKRNLIYAQAPVNDATPVLHVLDSENLTVRERIQIPENLAGRSVMSSDMNTMYSASISGVTIFPIGQLTQTQQIGTIQEDLLFAADNCNRFTLTQTLNIVNLPPFAPQPFPTSVETDFKLSLPDGVTGITLSAMSGTTPAQIQITVDPTAFQAAKGTTVIPLTITSNGAVNLIAPVRLLINTRDFNQRGQILNIPGKLVDMLVDPRRPRVYVIRQDRNQVLAFCAPKAAGCPDPIPADSAVPIFRTGNTPTQMAVTTDGKYLVVGNDNSSIASVYDLDTLTPVDPILFPFGHYPRAIGAAYSITDSGMFALIRPANAPPAGLLDHIFFDTRVADTPATLNAGVHRSIFKNDLPTPDGALASSPFSDSIFLSLADGTVAKYDVWADASHSQVAQTWLASGHAPNGLNGAYTTFYDGLYLAGNHLFDAALAPAAAGFQDNGAATSGAALNGGGGLRSITTAPNAPGILERIDFSTLAAFNATPMAEAPLTHDMVLTPPVGLIGETVLSFTRTLGVSQDQSQIFALTVSGVTLLDQSFDAALAKPVITSVVNPADNTPNVALGGLANINGFALAPGFATAGAPPLPTSLGEVCALFNNVPLPLFSVAPSRIVAQFPFNIPTSGSLVVHTPGGISDPFTVNVPPQAPAVFQILRNDNNQPLSFGNPIHPNTQITILMTGLGATTPPVAPGTPAPASPLAVVNNPPTVQLGTQPMSVLFATLVPGQVGVYQVIAQAPSKLSPSNSVPLIIQAGGTSIVIQVRVVTP
jgi:uncharacterized protein (TIGR03437 family)